VKLYAFQPEGHGPLSYFVMAESEAQARAAVRRYIVDNMNKPKTAYITGNDLRKWDDGYQQCRVFDVGEVITNDND